MYTQINHQSLNQTNAGYMARAVSHLRMWIRIGGGTVSANDLTTEEVAAQLPVGKPATTTDFCAQDGGWELALRRTIMMDIRGSNP
ncbi:hypothetical protein [Undibacterium sp. KW1]|uniref:hypothetical protein n=1 Tax=Undibacterium sp. KW1 TaxID=2058624 RepID=UPI001389C83B|nr:hypothetical protein [Undibacterium sp. KW1]